MSKEVRAEQGIDMFLPTPPEKVEKLQTALHTKAKAEPGFRFYALYDKMHRLDVLTYAYERCLANGGAAGVDGQTFEDIGEYGAAKWVRELAEELKTRTYKPQAVRRVWIPKADGKQRPLGIPTIRDRVAQMAAQLILEPIFEADLQPEQHAYRSGRSALEAVRTVAAHLDRGATEVVDADLSGYFDTIPHAELMKSVSRRIVDRHVLHVIKEWLEAAVEETDERGRKVRTTRNKDEGRGTPQGGVLSPLLANLYMRRFILAWKVQGHETRLDARIVNYADDFVILARDKAKADEAMAVMRQIMGKLRLTVNEKKTRRCALPEETFTFLGYTFGRCYSPRTGRAYISPRPSARKISAMTEKVSEMTRGRTTYRETKEVVRSLNSALRGWANYFCFGPVRQIYTTLMDHARWRLRRWLGRKHRMRRGVYHTYPNEYLHAALGLIQLENFRSRPLWANV
jgi:group II intron reverse transcriptase/maturase